MNNILNNMAYIAIKGLIQSGKSVPDIRGELRIGGLSDEIINEAFERFQKEFEENNKVDSLVDTKKKNEKWFLGAKESPDGHWNKLKGILKSKKNWSDEMIKSLDDDSNAVISRLSDPQVKFENKTKGLVLGYVQSGKTANYSAVISKALDSGYKFIIVLAGIHNNLRYQTEARLRAEIVEPSETSADPITRSDANGDFDEKHTHNANRVLGGEKNFGIAVLKKNSSVLRKFNNWLSNAKPEIINNVPVLIIDDESDQASVNTSARPDSEQTAINGHIRDIISRFKIVSYVGYTATPFANILINSGFEDDLFPRDFIVALKKPISYVGAEELFGAVDSEGVVRGGLPLIKIIDSYDASKISSSKKGEDKAFDELPESLVYAIECFVTAGAIRISRGQFKDHISMLVHGSYQISDQVKVHELVEDYLKLLRVSVKRSDEQTISRLMEIKKKEFEPTELLITQKINEISDSDFQRNLRLFLESSHVILDNSESDKRLSFEEKFWGIVVGGNTLSRGLTIEGLTISYFIRSSKMYDSLMQMGRWFGYRPGYLDLKRIFITDDLRQRFFEIATVENEIREEIRTMSEFGDKPIDLGIRIKQHPGMTVTARNKMRTAIAVEYSFSGRRVQPRYISLDERNLKKNRDSIFNFLKKLNSLGINKSSSGFKNFRTSLLYQGIDQELVLGFLDNYKISNANKVMSNNHIKEYIQNSKISKFNVGIMSQISDSDRFDFPNGEKISLLNRTYNPEIKSEEDSSAIYIRGLAVPRDEMIDMATFIENAPDNVDDVVEINGERKGFSYVRRKYRPKDTGLLLIYPINPNGHIKSSSEYSFDVKPVMANDIVFGVMFVFPESDKLAKGKYIINASIDSDTAPIANSNKPNSSMSPDDLSLLLKDVSTGRAISIRQPYVEEILIGKKKYEYRSRPTKIRGRVFLYASNTLGDISNCKKFKIDPESLPTGMIVGSVEIVDCVYFEQDEIYGYQLKNPIRYETAIKPDGQPQPLFFFPFGQQLSDEVDD